jgi:hypothetical protein
MVTSGDRLVSVSVRAGGRSRTLSRTRAPIDRRRHDIGERRDLGQQPKLVEGVGVSAAAIERLDLQCPDLTRLRVRIWRDQSAVNTEDRRGGTDAEG